jgi:MFS family permease
VQAWAIVWHVFALTADPYMVGLLGLCRVVPGVLLALVGGLVADSFDRRVTVLVVQALWALVAGGLALLSAMGLVTVWIVYGAVVFIGAIRAFEMPARAAIVPTLVPREHFPNAVSIHSVSWRLAEVLGPAVLGVILSLAPFNVGAQLVHPIALCYLFNFLSFFAMLAALIRLGPCPPQTEGEEDHPRTLRDAVRFVREGISFVSRNRVVRSSMLIDFWATFFSSADALLPFFAANILAVGAWGYSVMVGSIAVGSLVASGVLAWLPPVRRQGRGVIICIAAYGLCTVGFGLSPWFWLSVILLAGTGAADTVSTVYRQTIRQLATPDRMRGRMTSLSSLFFMTGPQLGDYEAGVLARFTGERFSVAAGGVACLGVAALWWRGKDLKNYVHE